jgi:hypothetical protein
MSSKPISITLGNGDVIEIDRRLTLYSEDSDYFFANHTSKTEALFVRPGVDNHPLYDFYLYIPAGGLTLQKRGSSTKEICHDLHLIAVQVTIQPLKSKVGKHEITEASRDKVKLLKKIANFIEWRDAKFFDLWATTTENLNEHRSPAHLLDKLNVMDIGKDIHPNFASLIH